MMSPNWVMAACQPGMDMADYLTNFQFIDGMTCTYIDSMGLLVFGLFVYGAISTSIYIRTGSVVIPTVLLFLTGGFVMGQLAGPASAIATILVLVTGAGAMTYLWYRYS